MTNEILKDEILKDEQLEQIAGGAKLIFQKQIPMRRSEDNFAQENFEFVPPAKAVCII